MKPYKYEIIDGVTHFRYHLEDLKSFMARGRSHGDNGWIVTKREGGHITLRGFGTTEGPSTTLRTFGMTWFTEMDGSIDGYDDRAITPPIPLWGHPKSLFAGPPELFFPMAGGEKPYVIPKFNRYGYHSNTPREDSGYQGQP